MAAKQLRRLFSKRSPDMIPVDGEERLSTTPAASQLFSGNLNAGGDDPVVNYGFGRGEGSDVDAEMPTAPQMSPTPTPSTPEPDAQPDRRKQSERLLEQINETQNTEQPREKSFWKRLGSGLFNGFRMWAESGGQGGLVGALAAAGTGAAGFAASPGLQAEYKQGRQVNKLWNQFGQSVQAENAMLDQGARQAQIDNIYADNQRREYEFAETQKWRQAEIDRKTGDRESREQTARMQEVGRMFRSLPSFDPNDPAQADMVKALGDVQLPIGPKDAKKKVDLKQDQRTGEWTVILTDPVSGKQEVRDVMKGGKKFASTPTVVMQGEYSLQRQQNQQNYDAGQRNQDRKLKMAEYMRKNNLDRQKFVMQLNEAVAAGKMTQAQADQMIADIPNDIQ